MRPPDSVDAFLEQSRERIDKHLDGALPPADEPQASLHEAMRYAAFSGGKRLRPAMVFAGALAAGADPDRALPAAAAAELVHTFSLVHDDLPVMDDDDERRGRRTVHVVWDEAAAILAGDALFAEAFRQLAEDGMPSALVARLARMAGSRALLGGQVDDLTFEVSGADLASVTRIHARKTASLFEFSAWSGGLLGGLEGPDLKRLDTYGHAYGLAYQLGDDLLDAGTDECSILSVTDAANARRLAQAQIGLAMAALAPLGRASWALRGLAESLTQRLP